MLFCNACSHLGGGQPSLGLSGEDMEGSRDFDARALLEKAKERIKKLSTEEDQKKPESQEELLKAKTLLLGHAWRWCWTCFDIVAPQVNSFAIYCNQTYDKYVYCVAARETTEPEATQQPPGATSDIVNLTHSEYFIA